MIWNFIIIGAVVVLFVLLIRRVPTAMRYQRGDRPKVDASTVTAYSLAAQADDAFEKRDFEKAEDLYIKIAATEPNNAKVYNRLGAIYLEQKNFYDAKDAFLQSIKLEPDNATRYANLGMAYLGLKDYFKAEQAFNDALKYDFHNDKYRKLQEKAKKLREKEKKKK